jgi:hypothetical protein
MLITWLFDRHHQTDAVKDAVRRAQVLGTPLPTICLLHGNEDECHDMFVARIVDYELEKLNPSLGEAEHKVLSLPPNKPGSALDLHGYLRARLGDKFVNNEAAPLAEINRCFANLRAPVVIHSWLSIERWGKDARSKVQDYLAFWNQWPDLTAGQLLVVFLCINVRPPALGWLSSLLGGRDQDLDAALAEFSTLDGTGRRAGWERIICTPLPALGPITRDQAMEWATDPEVQQCFAGHYLPSAIGQIYDAQRADALPMAMLHQKLRAALQLPVASESKEFA